MKKDPFSSQDKLQLKKQGIAPSGAREQLARFRKGFSHAELVAPCTVKSGISKLSAKEEKDAENRFLLDGRTKKILKFVPASGAASRMFHFLEDANPQYDDLKQKFLKHLPQFAFYGVLKKALKKQGHNIEKLRKSKKLAPIVRALLEPEGLGYRATPKGMILFHGQGNTARTAFEAQMNEAVIFSNKKNKVAVHFTVPMLSRAEVKRHLKDYAAKKPSYRFELSESIQSPATDCLAVESTGKLVRNNQGQLLLRPSGHGALLDNLNRIGADLIYVKNIDNILPAANRAEADRWKRILCGVFLKTQESVFKAQRILNKEKMSPYEALEAINLATQWGWKNPEKKSARKSLSDFFNRPLRICGMVPNTGEPGGGPFWVKQQSGQVSAQIIESAEVDFKSKTQEKIWRSSTHFNPVDFVCGMTDYQGRPYNLMKYKDEERGLISRKNYQGREICVMELPGLWNGSMAHWLTLFIETPATVFAPVKTVLDLLRKEHQVQK